ncbi:MAG: hypothetical protein IAE87_02910 [Rhodobacteraceae bacterium]|jgi:hypothetical protein|nr:hypothetical protein [Paracoccaceae bacterium]
MRAAAVLTALLASALPVLAEGPVTADQFEAHVTGKTLTYARGGAIFGIEQYLPGRKVRWQFTADTCQYGSWYPKEGGLICFLYEYDTREHCWTFRMVAGRLTAQSADDLAGAELAEVEQTAQGLACPGPDVGV